MEENVCMKCRRRKCSFRSYEREDCPYEPTLPRLYKQEREAWREGAEKWRTEWQKRNPLLKHFQIKEPEIDFDALKITRRLMAEVTDTTDAFIVEAIRKEAERQGFTDLYLIDRGLVRNVIAGATPKRGRWIDPEKLPQLLREGTDENGDALVTLAEVRKALRLATVDASEVRGQWVGVEYDGYADGCPVYDVWECSVCGFEYDGEEPPCFCENCGAKMYE